MKNNISCKLVSYLLSVFTRSIYWLMSWIIVDRVLILLFPTSISFKNSCLSICSSICTVIVIFVMHLHEIVFYRTIQNPHSSAVLCMTNFNQNFISIYNRVSTLIHYLIPFCIQIVSITILIVLIARSRAKTTESKATF
jgi:hypothetical protein